MMNKKLNKLIAMTVILGMTSYASAQSTNYWDKSGNTLSGSEKLGSLNDKDLNFFTHDILRMSLTQNGWLGLGIQQPRGWMEVNYCPPIGQDNNGLIVTRNYCYNGAATADMALPDNIGGGVSAWNPTPPEQNTNFVVPFSFRTGNTTNIISPLLNPNSAPMFWVRSQSPTGFWQGSGTDKFDTKFIVMPDGSCGINVVQPRAALDVRGSNAPNRPAAIIGSRALNTNLMDPITNTMTYYTQQVQFVPILNENGYNRIVQANDQGMFFTDGKGLAGANLNSAFVIAPWVEGNNSDKGGMRMDNNGNTEFHGTLRATKLNVDVKWWSDFVFDDNYKLMNLTDLEAYIKMNKHLPNVPAEAEVLENGIDLANMHAIQQQKLEELTLYIIQQQKLIEQIQSEINNLKN